jgi:lipoteichoic acid synthase
VLLSRRDWVYSLSLLVPLAVYNLTLKACDIASRPGGFGLTRSLNLMRSDIFFNLGYALVWTGLFATARGGPLRWTVVVLFHAMTTLVATVRTCAHQYFRQTGTTLDYDILALWFPRFDEIKPMLKVPLLARVLLFFAAFYAALGPWLVTRAVGRWRGWSGISPTGTPGISLLGSLGLCLQGLGFGALSLLAGSSPAGASRSFARDPLVNLILTGAKEAIAGEDDSNVGADGRAVERPATNARLVPTPGTEKRNVVLIHLESTRARSVTPYNEGLETTPFLYELAKSSLLAERAYTTVPHTSKASVSVNCGIEPHLVQQATEANPGGIPARGLADLLMEQGYGAVFFQSSTENFDNFRDLTKNFGYEEYYPLESMSTEGFERSNYFGYEDDIMLKPSEEWLKKRRSEPFVAEYLTGTAHHDYAPPARYESKDFSEDDLLNRYLNCVRYQDSFVKNLIDQYKALGLYDNTIFVIYGDHGEGFGEHGRYVHEDNPYEESLKVPLIIHAPGWFENGERVEGLSNLTDILPTVLEMLGYEVKDGEYPGYSLLHPVPKNRTLMFSCFNKNKCLASIRGFEKYIYHYGNQPDEFFDLSEDPSEERNLTDRRAEEAGERRGELLMWRSRVNAIYTGKRYGRSKGHEPFAHRYPYE